jgi:hypothetical protein
MTNNTPLTPAQMALAETTIRADAERFAAMLLAFSHDSPHVAMAILGATIEHIIAPLPPAEARQLITDWLASFDQEDTNAA